MSDSRLEKFIYAICSMDVSDLPVPLSRIEKLWNCLITGETPDFEPLSRNEKYLMAMLDRYDISNLPAPMSRGEQLLYKIAVGETDLSDVPGYLSRYEELLKYLIENGGISGGDFEYVLYTLNQSLYTLYTTAEKPVKSAILKGNTGYRDIDTGEFLETFEEGRNLELVSVKMPVLKTTGKNLFDGEIEEGVIDTNTGEPQTYKGRSRSKNFIRVPKNTDLYINVENGGSTSWTKIYSYDENKKYLGCLADSAGASKTFNTGDASYIKWKNNTSMDTLGNIQIEEGSVATEYEPYKSNILTVNEDVTLRGIGDVQDKLDCLTGEVTESIGEIILDGTQYMEADGRGIYIQVDDMKKVEDYRTIITCDKLPVFYQQWDLPIVENGISGYRDDNNIYPGQNWLYIKVNNSIDVNEVRQILTQNPITAQYELSVESIKTVDLTVVDQDNQPTELGTFENVTHVSLEAENLIPEVEMEVATRISTELASASPLMDDISTEQQQLETTVDEQSNNVDATMIATTEIYEEIL